MTTNYPSGLDNLAASRGADGDTLASPDHVTHHTNEDDAITAIQTYLGIIGSAVTSTITYLLTSVSSIDPGHKHTKNSVTLAVEDLSDANISSPADGQLLTYDAATSKWKNEGTAAPDASTTVKGVTKLSVAPASPTSPIALGANDPILNTHSGTPLDGSTNTIIDADDVDAAATANKVARRNSNGDVTVPATPTSTTDAASMSYVNTGDSFVSGVVADLLATTAGNNDVTVTTTFTPRLIRIHYWIQGEGTSTNYSQVHGTAVYNGTTLLFNKVDWYGATGAGGTDNTPVPVNNTFMDIDIAPDSTSPPATGSGGIGVISITLSIASVSSTGFVIRRATAITSGSANARAKIAYEAFA